MQTATASVPHRTRTAPENPALRDPDDAELAALHHLEHVQRPALLTFARRLTAGDRHRAEDVVQETVLRAWCHPEVRDADNHWPMPWLATVARRVLIDQVRATRCRPAELLDGWGLIDRRGGRTDEIDRMLDRRAVLSALSALPELQRTILVELYLRESTSAETAAALGIPRGTVRSRAHYALRALRSALEQNGFLNSRPGGAVTAG